MSRYSILAPIALLIAGAMFFPALSHAQSASCSQELQLAVSASEMANNQDAVENALNALEFDDEAMLAIVNATPTCNSVLTGQDLASFQNLMLLANQDVNEAIVANETNQIAHARVYELQLITNLDQAIQVAAGR